MWGPTEQKINNSLVLIVTCIPTQPNLDILVRNIGQSVSDLDPILRSAAVLFSLVHLEHLSFNWWIGSDVFVVALEIRNQGKLSIFKQIRGFFKVENVSDSYLILLNRQETVKF